MNLAYLLESVDTLVGVFQKQSCKWALNFLDLLEGQQGHWHTRLHNLDLLLDGWWLVDVQEGKVVALVGQLAGSSRV